MLFCFVFNEREKIYRRRSNFYVCIILALIQVIGVLITYTVLKGSDIEWERRVDCDLYQRFKGWRSYLTLTFVQSYEHCTTFGIIESGANCEIKSGPITTGDANIACEMVINPVVRTFRSNLTWLLKSLPVLRTILQNTDYIRQDTRFVIRHCLCWAYVCMWYDDTSFGITHKSKYVSIEATNFTATWLYYIFMQLLYKKKRVQLRTTYTFIILKDWQKLK